MLGGYELVKIVLARRFVRAFVYAATAALRASSAAKGIR
jgi:hypothetical protein